MARAGTSTPSALASKGGLCEDEDDDEGVCVGGETPWRPLLVSAWRLAPGAGESSVLLSSCAGSEGGRGWYNGVGWPARRNDWIKWSQLGKRSSWCFASARSTMGRSLSGKDLRSGVPWQCCMTSCRNVVPVKGRCPVS